MRMTIAQRYRPFSHENGSTCLLPRSSWSIQAFPTFIRFRNREREGSLEGFEISLPLHGIVREFTVQQDLENGFVFVWGIAKEGRFRLRWQAISGGIELLVEKAPSTGLICGGKTLFAKDREVWKVSGAFFEPSALERLSFGLHRSQNWPEVMRRMDLREILPILFHLGQWMPAVENDPETCVHRLLDSDDALFETTMEEFLQVAFSGILSPRLVDDEYQGIVPVEAVPSRASAISLILKAKKRIRSLVVQQEDRKISILPACPFIAGRMTDVQCPQVGTLDFEWTKGKIRQLILRADQDTDVQFEFPRTIGSYRLRTGLLDAGIRKSSDSALILETGKKYLLDRFQK